MDTATKREFRLIEGEFSPEQAYEILNGLFTNKINYHNRKNFSLQINKGKTDPLIDHRISELKLSQKQIKEIITEAKLTGKTLRVGSKIHIELV